MKLKTVKFKPIYQRHSTYDNIAQHALYNVINIVANFGKLEKQAINNIQTEIYRKIRDDQYTQSND